MCVHCPERKISINNYSNSGSIDQDLLVRSNIVLLLQNGSNKNIFLYCFIEDKGSFKY